MQEQCAAEEVKNGGAKSAPSDSIHEQQSQPTPEETTLRWQRILDALDEDHDGKIELKHVLAVSHSLHFTRPKLHEHESVTSHH